MKRIIAIGGGELRERTTLKIDEYIAKLAKERAGENRPNALFIPTASHDYMPYYNTFHKVYTGVFNIKTDVIYVGGGDTVFMIEHWKQSGLLPLIKDAYERGVIIAGLSAGAICWFSDIYTDSTAALGEGDKYAMFQGLGWIEGKISPHYGARMLDFDNIVCYNFDCAYGIEDDAALVIEDGEIVGSLSSGGKAWKIEQKNGALNKTEIPVL